MNDRLGIDFENFENSSWPRLAMASPVIAVMLIGTFCNVSLRFWAVTTISPPPLSAVAWSSCCAAAAAAGPKTADANSRQFPQRIFLKYHLLILEQNGRAS